MESVTYRVWVILLNYNNTPDTLECLDSLRSVIEPKLFVVVVDNGSAVNPVAELRAHYSAVHVIENGCNLGFAEANNIGLRFALEQGADYLFVLNNDTTVSPDAIARLISSAERDSAIGMICPAITSYYDHSKRFVPVIDWHNGGGGEWPLAPVETACRDVDYASGCAQLVKAKVAQTIGLYDPAFFIYYEDADWSRRCKQAGYKVVMDASVVIYHKGTPDQIGQKWSASWYYYLRNQPLFFWRHGKRSHWPYVFLRHTRNCMSNFHTAMLEDNQPKADAVLDGWLAGLLRRYGAQRFESPSWAKKIMSPLSLWIVRSYDVLEPWWRRLPLERGVAYSRSLLYFLRQKFPVRTSMRRFFNKA